MAKYQYKVRQVEGFEITHVKHEYADQVPGRKCTVCFMSEDGCPMETPCDEAMTARFYPSVGDYVVIQPDGYVYLNPKKVFEEKFEKVGEGNIEIESKEAWIGVDLDGTLAIYDRWKGKEHIGKPVPSMLFRVKNWIANGKRVKIFTARCGDPEAVIHIQEWLESVGLPVLEITNKKDYLMSELWDDRATQVIPNDGTPIESLINIKLEKV